MYTLIFVHFIIHMLKTSDFNSFLGFGRLCEWPGAAGRTPADSQKNFDKSQTSFVDPYIIL